jgi:hypothetical protein
MRRQNRIIESRDQADRARAERHADQRHDESVFAAGFVAQPAEHEGSQRTNQKSGGEQRDRGE